MSDPRFSLAARLSHSEWPHWEIPQIDVLIDVSLPPHFADRLRIAEEKRIPIVIGTTGLSETDRQLIEKCARIIPIFYSANFSIGMAILKKLAADASRYFPSPAEIELIETHHAEKRDAPSGSALAIAQEVQRSRPGREPPSIQSIRTGQIVGEHTLLFNTPEERLTLSHQAHSRTAFARGALAAALFLGHQRPGLYGIESIFNN